MDADLLRRTTDRLVLAALLDAGQLTRAELAQRVGISRPTASESVRRLADAGLVEEAGRQQGARGRSGTYCRVVPGAGRALVAHAGPGEVVAEVVDAAAGPDESPAADRVHRHPIGSTTTVAELTTALHTLLGEVEAAHGPLPVDRVLSVADPVDSAHGRLVLLEGSPFVLDEGSLRDVIGDAGVLDNDVHWAALAERAARADAGDPVDNFLYVYLGAGLGAAVVDEGRLVTGRRGLGGEIAYVLTQGADGRATRLLDALCELDVALPGTTSLDPVLLRERLVDEATRRRVGEAVGGALASCVSLLDPGLVVLGGPWSDAPGLVDALTEALDPLAPYPVRLESAVVRRDAPFLGARARAVALARERLLDAV
ncbi:ROK family protein [Arsenicicoccus piscis]|uniref:ROK family transcriptional regulator n=1 Tax=Arsenicicoccus piscis TaxID=673954 RepID=UPI001F4CC42E|nr:ROK family transcriptional regulator [Arsenicicoccus piscis]MCH8627530.1 ROK family protein [Arsenicicoccus piscis]